jgi:acetyltransferase-like isoleucine patch superfamily enzyme
MRGRRLFKLTLPVITLFVAISKILPRSIRYFLLIMFRNMPGYIGIGIRYIFLKSLALSCGKNVKVKSYVLLSHLDNLEIGNNVSINEFCSVGCLGGVSIGDNVAIAHGTTILSTEHDFLNQSQGVKEAPTITKKTKIGSGVWLGAKTVITAGVVIGENAVIGAGSVVTKDIPADTVAAGVPAKVIKHILK